MEESASIVTDTPDIPTVTDVNVDVAASVESTSRKRTRKSKASSKPSKSAKKKTSSEPTVESILSQSYYLDANELSRLIEALIQLKAAQDQQDEDERQEHDDQESQRHRKRRGRGRAPRIESKMINGCGPYDYLRWWDGKTYKSTYLGKSKG